MSKAKSPARAGTADARLDALTTVIDSLMSTLVMRGVINRAELENILQSSEATVKARSSDPAAVQQVAAIRKGIPEHMRAALGPEPDEDDHDH